MMKHSIYTIASFLHLIILIGLLSACTAGGDRMRQQLYDLQARNQADSLLTDDSLATALCHWFDRHGTPNERMLAHYLMGRTWADKGEAPQALEEYHTAADCADTTATDCDYRLLTRIYAQTASLFYEQQMPYEMLEELDQMRSSAIKACDTLSWIVTLEWKTTAYDLLGDKKKALEVILRAKDDYALYGYENWANNCLANIIDYLIKNEDLVNVDSLIKHYESHSSFFKNGIAVSGHEYYYNVKGDYYTAIGKLDSADYYFRKELYYASRPNDKEAAYKGLYGLFQKKGNADSVAKYADLCYKTSDNRFRQSKAEQLSHMQSLYNYNRSREEARKKEIESSRSRQQLSFAISVIVVICVVFVSLLYVQKKRKKEEIRKKEMEYLHNYEVMEQAKVDMILMKEHEYDMIVKQKEEEIQNRQNVIEHLQAVIHPEDNVDIDIASSDIYKRLQFLCAHPKEQVTDQEWKRLEEIFQRQLPQFSNILNAHYHISPEDLRVCMLIRLHFTPSEISILTNYTIHNLGMKRKRLLKRIFMQDGKAEDFDRILLTIKQE